MKRFLVSTLAGASMLLGVALIPVAAFADRTETILSSAAVVDTVNVERLPSGALTVTVCGHSAIASGAVRDRNCVTTTPSGAVLTRLNAFMSDALTFYRNKVGL